MEYLDKLVGVSPRPFSLTDTKFDQSTFYGRWRYFIDLVSPANLFYSLKQAQDYKKLLEDYKEGKVTNISDSELWKAKGVVQSTFHPDTGEPISIFFRFSSFGPANVPIMIGMLLSKKTAFSIPFWQAVNQTYNVGFNYNNRSINSEFTNTQLVVSYLLATSSSVIISVYLDKLITRRGGTSLLFRTLGPATAVAIAGCFNLMVIRYRELFEGIKVYDKENNFLGMSKIAAYDGLKKTFAIRFGMQYPCCFWPVLMGIGMKKIGFYPSSGLGKLGSEVFILCTAIYLILTACFASYPQILYKKDLESYLHSPDGFYYNRGL
jgi:sideroflexin-5